MADAAAITIAATLGTAPLMALHFQQISLAALPANLLAAPAIAPVMWLGVLAAGAAQVAAPLATPFSALTAPLLVYLQKTAHLTGASPLSVVEVHASPVAIVATWVGARRRDAPRPAAPRRRAARRRVRFACRADEHDAGRGIASRGCDERPRARLATVPGSSAAVRGLRLATVLLGATLALFLLAGGIPGRGARAAPRGRESSSCPSSTSARGRDPAPARRDVSAR